jgi:hypothetical protein
MVGAIILLLGLATHAVAADVPPAGSEFRKQIAGEYVGGCVKGIEDQPNLRAIYSRKTVETYCTCRQRYRADVLAQALKNGERGKAVSDRASDYSHEKCVHILLKNLERE